MSVLEQLIAVGEGADHITNSTVKLMLDSVNSGKVNFANIFPKSQKIWQKIPLIINDVPLEEKCQTLLNMSNGNRKVAIRKVVEGHFDASPQSSGNKNSNGASNISSFVEKFYSSNGLNMAGYVTKQILNFVLPGNVGSQAEAIAYVLNLHKQGVELFVWLKTTFWCTLRNIALIALLHGQKLEDRNIQDLLLWCFLQHSSNDASVNQSNFDELVSKIAVVGGTEQTSMERIRALFPEDASDWQRQALERADKLFSPRKQLVMNKVSSKTLSPVFSSVYYSPSTHPQT